MRLFRRSASGTVLLLLCAMYFITYVDQVNVASAAAFKSELGLSNTQLGLAFSGSLLCSAPILVLHSPLAAAICLSLTFFFAEVTIGPMWAIPMDIAPQYAGTASGLMNTGSALAAILSPMIFGIVIDQTGSWTLPFLGTMGLMLIGLLVAFTMRPDRHFGVEAASPELAPLVA